MLTRRQIVLRSLASLATGSTLIARTSRGDSPTDDEQSKSLHLAMGFRVGEVSQSAAIVWTRVTALAEPNWNGKAPEPLESDTRTIVINEAIPIEHREGAVPGAAGEVRLVLSSKPGLSDPTYSEWITVQAQQDYTHQFAVDTRGTRDGASRVD